MLDIQNDVAKISACIRIAKDFAVIVTIFADLLKDTVKQLSQVMVNLMTRLRS